MYLSTAPSCQANQPASQPVVDAMSGPPIPFSSLPVNKDNPLSRLNAWGVYGPDDEVGFLNRQTPDIIAAAAASEIKTGIRVALDAPLSFQGAEPLFGRQAFQQDMYQKKPKIVHDDTWSFNTQTSSQWDGLRHYAYQKVGLFHNGTTLEQIATTEKLGMGKVVQRGGITGRAVLVDFARWKDTPEGARAVNGEFENFKTCAIKLAWIQETLAYQGTEVRFGDILVVRSGWFPAFRALSEERLAELRMMRPPPVGGLEQSSGTLQWIWDNFSAVASDQPSFERWPTPLDWSLHEVLLAGWGCNIGEMWDLEEVSKRCEALGRWSFFLVSMPTHVPGGVASPSNAVAIF